MGSRGDAWGWVGGMEPVGVYLLRGILKMCQCIRWFDVV